MTKTARIKLIVLLVVTVFVLIITFQNIGPQPFRILFWSPEVSLSIAIIATFLLGIGGGMLIRPSRK